MRGRPVGSKVRQNIVDLLFLIGEAHGYIIYKIYNAVFPKVSQRLIYYHLKKGVDIGEFKIKHIRNVSGDFSWGSNSERVYYCLGELANPNPNKRLVNLINKIKTKFLMKKVK